MPVPAPTIRTPRTRSVHTSLDDPVRASSADAHRSS
jgi:hypothetical protein